MNLEQTENLKQIENLEQAKLDDGGKLLLDGVIERPGFTAEVSIEVAAGQTAALLGPNGSGKSTIVAAIAGLLPLRTGKISLGAHLLDDPAAGVWVDPAQRHIGVAFQDGLLFGHMTVLDNVAFGLRSRGVSRSQAGDQAGRKLREVGLPADVDGRMPDTLSGGQAQSVALARALVGEPRLLLLDEPLGALDLSVRTRLRRDFVGLLGQASAPRLLITHDPTDAFLLADVIHIIEDGRITQTGSPDQIRRRPATRYAADLTGINLLFGSAHNGQVQLADMTLHVADTTASGPVLATVHPRAATLHRERPTGSPRNVWQSRVGAVEHLGSITRVALSAPLQINVDVTTMAAQELRITVDDHLWVAIKATEIELTGYDGE